MENDQTTLWEKRKAASEEYRNGVRDGWDQAKWAMIAICVVVFFITQWFPV